MADKVYRVTFDNGLIRHFVSHVEADNFIDEIRESRRGGGLPSYYFTPIVLPIYRHKLAALLDYTVGLARLPKGEIRDIVD